jgi:hypothetical protein
MDKNIIHQLHGDFERCANTDETTGVEYWFARDLQKLLGYTQWRNFEPVIEKAITACMTAGENPDDHFARTQIDRDRQNRTERSGRNRSNSLRLLPYRSKR